MGKGGSGQRPTLGGELAGYDVVEELDYEDIQGMANLPTNFRHLDDPVRGPSTRAFCEMFIQLRTGKLYKVHFPEEIAGGLAATDMKDNVWLNPNTPRWDASAEIRMVTLYGNMAHEISHILWNRAVTMQKMIQDLGDPAKGGEGKLDPKEFPPDRKWHIKQLLNTVLDGNCEWRTYVMRPNLFGMIHASNAHTELACFSLDTDEVIAWYDEYADPPRDPKERAARAAQMRKLSEQQRLSHQVTGALLYQALPDRTVPMHMLDPRVKQAFYECLPHLEAGVLGNDNAAYEAAKEIFRILLRYDLLEPLKPNERPAHAILVTDAQGSSGAQQVSLEQVLKDGGKIILVKPKGGQPPGQGQAQSPGQGQGQGQGPGQGQGQPQPQGKADGSDPDPTHGSTGGRLAEQERREQGLDANAAPQGGGGQPPNQDRTERDGQGQGQPGPERPEGEGADQAGKGQPGNKPADPPGQGSAQGESDAAKQLQALQAQINSAAEGARKDAGAQVMTGAQDNERRRHDLNEMFGGKGSKEIQFPSEASDQAALYQRDWEAVARQRSYFSEELMKVLEEGIGMKRFREQGMLNPEQLIQGSLGDKDIFRELIPQRQFDMAISILIDTSGSMSGVREDLQRMCILIASTCEDLQIPCEIWSFGQAQLPFKGFDEDYPFRLGAISSNIDGGTPMMEGVLLADQRIRDREERSRAVFIVTDGAPNGENDAVPKIRRVLDDLISDGISVFGVYVGRGQEEALRRLFKHFSICPSLEQVPDLVVDRFCKILQDAVRGGGIPSY